MNLTNKYLFTSISVALLSTQLTACGGSGESEEVTDNAHSSEPMEITASNWQNTQAKLLSTATLEARTRSIPNGNPRNSGTKWYKYLYFKLTGVETTPKHSQIHIDIDNNPSTGYQFKDEAWSKSSGIDYIIEDGHLYKSTANDSSWSWEWVQGGAGGKGIRLDAQKTFTTLCNDLNIGYIEYDDNWNISDFYPKSNTLLKQTVSFCDTYDAAPKLTMNGVKSMVIELNDPLYSDPGATALDEEDGDISSKIKVTSNVDITKEGSYTINYEITDSHGTTVKLDRTVNIVTPNQTGITIDGKNDDWATINPLVDELKVKRSGNFRTTRSYTLKATDTQNYLYFYANAWVQQPSIAPPSASGPTIGEHWQIFIDSDDNAATGWESFDYLIEDGQLYKFSGTNSQQWAWKVRWLSTKFRNISAVSTARGFSTQRPTKGSVEVKLHKSVLSQLKSKKINIRFSALGNNWSQLFAMPIDSSKLSVSYDQRNTVLLRK